MNRNQLKKKKKTSRNFFEKSCESESKRERRKRKKKKKKKEKKKKKKEKEKESKGLISPFYSYSNGQKRIKRAVGLTGV